MHKGRERGVSEDLILSYWIASWCQHRIEIPNIACHTPFICFHWFAAATVFNYWVETPLKLLMKLLILKLITHFGSYRVDRWTVFKEPVCSQFPWPSTVQIKYPVKSWPLASCHMSKPSVRSSQVRSSGLGLGYCLLEGFCRTQRGTVVCFFLILFILIGGLLLYHIVMIFAIHQYESVIGVQCPLHSESPSRLLPHPIPQVVTEHRLDSGFLLGSLWCSDSVFLWSPCWGSR